MAKIKYEDKKMGPRALYIIQVANRICSAYYRDGYNLTLRQLYYQFVARDLFPDDRRWRWTGRKWVRDPNGTKNATPNYTWLGNIINDARMAGLLDWNYIVDRTRNLMLLAHWDNAAHAVQDAARRFQIDMWARQPKRVEVWVEKDALIGVLERVANRNDVPYFSCRGYTSQSEVWSAAQRIGAILRSGQSVVILHLGDHDPSGIDMTRDIVDRLEMFIKRDQVNLLTDTMWKAADKAAFHVGRFSDLPPDFQARMTANMRRAEDSWGTLSIERIALNMDQIEQYRPPPNPAKVTDSRYKGYAELHGDESWELDALAPDVLDALIQRSIEAHRDDVLWNEDASRMENERTTLKVAGERWVDVAAFLEDDDA